ncbi:OsmC family peroxiredoxin [Lentibacillus salicampi]|uniref:OsmC family peroxiredoxin n=2 Tax=Lentibacillus salicampi TaxID=175306 RepID=A0A4Y9A7H3_9BACI|nr:OsmC family protein [Lentibacillus salicampi]TFJ91706.1 OsmC family peroxiredoxin [Lentibacillus salicampi]
MNFYLREEGMQIDFDYGQLDISSDEAHGFRPYQLMVASIAGCSGSVFRKIINKQRMDYDDLTITAEVERNPEEADKIEQIDLYYYVKGRQLNPDRLHKNLELSRKNCSMVRSVEDSITINEHLEVIELSR